MQFPSIDVIFPISDPWLYPYLFNACSSIVDQHYPRELIRIYVSLYYKDKPGDITQIVQLCSELEAVLVFTKWSDPVWNIGKAYNVAARCGSRDVIACFDADVVFHPKTFRKAARHLRDDLSTVVPVARSRYGPESALLWTRDDKKWRELTESLGDQRCGVGNILIPRRVFEHLHGFDERMCGWGSIDEDMYYRAMKHKGAVYLLDHGCPKAIHQKHPPTPTKGTEYTKKNRELMLGAKNPVRNPDGWGGIPES